MAFAVSNSPARADITTTTWTGTSGDWFTSINWSNGVPTSSTDAFINNGGKATINQSGATARSLTLGFNPGESGTVLVDGMTGGRLDVPQACANEALGIFPGLISVGYGGRGTLSIINGGTVTSQYGYIGLLPGGGTARPSNGTVTVDGVGSTWSLKRVPEICDDAALYISGNSPNYSGGIALLNVTNGGTVIVDNKAGSRFSVVLGTSGTVTGNGIITVNGFISRPATKTLVAHGTLAPSGRLTIYGDLDLTMNPTTLFHVTPQGTDNVDVEPPAPGLGGRATLGGRLIVILSGTFTRGTTCTTRFILLHADPGIAGTFSQGVSIQDITLNPPYTAQINYDNNNVYLDLVFNDCE